MELAVEQHCEEKTKFQIKLENVLQVNDRLLTQALSVEIMNIVVHDNVKSACLNVDACARCVTTESELKPDFIKKECHETLLQKYHTLEKHYISLEVNNQLNTEIFQRNTLSSPESAPTFAELFKINDLKAQAQAKDTVILKLRDKLNSLSGNVNERKVKREVEEIETLNIELDHKVTKLVAENEHLKQTYKQLYDLIKSSRVRSKEQCDDLINKVNLKSAEVSDLNASLQEKVLVITALIEHIKSKSVKTPVKRKVWLPTGNVFKTVGHIWKPTGRTFTLVGNVCPLTRIATPTILPPREPMPVVNNTDKPVVTLVVQIVLWYLDSGCSKHMTGDRSQLINFVQKILGTVQFGNDHVAKIMGYGDYQIGNVTISRVYYMEGLGHNLFSVGQFCDSDLEVRLKVPVRQIQTDNRTEFVNQTLSDYYEEVGTSHETSVARSPQQNGVVERRNRTLIEAARTMLIYTQAPLFYGQRLWQQPVLLKISSSGPALNKITPGTISSGLVRTSFPSTSYVPPSRNDWDLLYQPMFDELLNPPPSVVNQAPKVIAPIAKVIPPVHADSTGSPSSTTISQSPRGIFINQSKYALESLKKYGFESCDSVDTPMAEKSKLDEDREGKAVDPSHYR
nr:integrase, catalytic region, zinc finger, CCHC-type, peptidase aspartic, catalytic [Tanacetum cinerariifolium]